MGYYFHILIYTVKVMNCENLSKWVLGVEFGEWMSLYEEALICLKAECEGN